MKHKILKLFMLANILCLAQACDYSETIEPTKNNTTIKPTEDSILSINNKQCLWHLKNKNSNTTKGYTGDNEHIEFGIAHVRKSDRKYKTMKVYRQSNPKQYFYVMLENLDIKINNGSWAYNNNEKNVEKFGRLYTYNAAEKCRKEVYMELPSYLEDGTEYQKISRSYAKLPSHEDICDLMESDHYDESGNLSIDDLYFDLICPYGYIDIFITGNNKKCSTDEGFHSLGGYKDNDNKNNFSGLNYHGYYWTSINRIFPNTSLYFKLEIVYDKKSNEYLAYINNPNPSGYGYSVRYVFYPNIKKTR